MVNARLQERKTGWYAGSAANCWATQSSERARSNEK